MLFESSYIYTVRPITEEVLESRISSPNNYFKKKILIFKLSDLTRGREVVFKH